MKQVLLTAVLLGILGGCTTTKNVQVVSPDISQHVVSNYADVAWIKTTPPEDINFSITENTQVLTTENGRSPVAGFEIDTLGAEVEVTLSSYIKKTAYSPKVLILNDKDQVIKTIENDEFKYVEASLMVGDRLETSFSIRGQAGKPMKLLVVTDSELATGSTTVVHPAKQEAKAKGNYPPDIPDPVIPHSYYGEFTLSLYSEKVIVIEEPQVIEEKSPGDTIVDPTLNKSIVKPLRSTQDYYLKAIQKAVEFNDIPKALSLLEEAKALNIEGAQQAFVEAVNAR